jgi:UDP-GlcNAc:undecaprenyl-phosphate GlcNAc-1-phosphate transferase
MNNFIHTTSLNIESGLVWSLIAFSIALMVSYLSYPVIIRVSKLKGLMSQPNDRSVHKNKTPNLGGIGIFLAIYLAITFLGNHFGDQILLNLLGSLTIMFFIGLVDDLISIRPKSKLIGQIIASLYVILMTDLRIENLHGLLGIYELPYLVSLIASVVFYVVIINSYNLIDGVDGLAGVFAITISVIFGYFFYINGNYSMFFLSVSMIGAIIPFLIFNFSKTNKIFMGDTGSMIIGFLLAYQAINFMSSDFIETATFISSRSLIYFLALFSYPFVDTIRVFYIRLNTGKNPFTADKNHIHHILLSKGLKHGEISLLVSAFTITMVFWVFIFNGLEINKHAIILGVVWFFSAIIISNFNLNIELVNAKAIKGINLVDSTDSKKGKIFQLKKLISESN